MDETAKYLIHAEITAAGVVERSDVVGAVFGQTEGLLGDELDLRDLQDSKKVGRIDVNVRSEGGNSYGEITVGSGLDKVETAILAAALETIEQVGPCSAEIVVTDIEDIRSAKRRAVVERATELLAAFDADAVRTEDIVETVRKRARVEDITTYEGLPAGPRVADSDAVVVVEGRADVLQLLKHGVKNAIAVEGTDIPEAAAALTRERTVTAFLDGDRGGDLILEELSQVGQLDYVAVAPRGRSVEDLSYEAVMSALREKIPYETVADADSAAAALDAGTGEESVTVQPGAGRATRRPPSPASRARRRRGRPPPGAVPIRRRRPRSAMWTPTAPPTHRPSSRTTSTPSSGPTATPSACSTRS
nr:DNA primase DnaG [Halomicroarcula sp. SHR3]